MLPMPAGLMEQAGASAGVPVEARKQSPTGLAFQARFRFGCSQHYDVHWTPPSAPHMYQRAGWGVAHEHMNTKQVWGLLECCKYRSFGP